MSRGILFTGDLQAEFENLDTLKEVISQMDEYSRKKNAVATVWLGDIKNRYNPIDGRVLNYVVETVHRLNPVFILLGNHDRFALHSDEESWLSTLQRAGAHVYVKESAVGIGEFELYMLPYRSDADETRKMSDHLFSIRTERHEKHKCHILCFHTQLNESDVPVQGSGSISVDDLHPKSYDYCLGGHIHKRQQVKYEHVQYVGSPFASTWGEVNQRKGFVYVEA